MFQTTKQLPKGDDLLALCSGGTVPMISPWYCDMAVSINGGTPKWLKIRKIMWKNWWKWGVPHNLGCVLFWLVSVTPWKSRFLPSKSRKVEKSKSSHARRFRLEKSKKSKKSKSRKVEKSKNSNNSKNSKKFEKSNTFLAFWLFAKIFPGRVINPVGFWRHWSTGSIHAQGFLWLFGCSFPVDWLVTFQGSRKLAISVSRLDFVLLTENPQNCWAGIWLRATRATTVTNCLELQPI